MDSESSWSGACGAPDHPNIGSVRDEGMVTAELAVALPALVVVALLALAGVQVAMTQLECRDAAAVAARLAARGEREDVVATAVASAAPAGSHLSIRTDHDLVEASVRTQVRLPGLGGLLPAFGVTETVAAVAEVAVTGP